VIVGGGAAGFAAAEMLRREDYRGSIVMLSNDSAPPVDRPNLSKDYLAGSAPEDWLPLRPDSFYAEAGFELRLDTDVASINTNSRNVTINGGETISYDRLLLATGAEPVRLPIPGADQPHVHVLRTLADCRAIIASAKGARRAIVIGASFIGLEAAAALRSRDIEVHVVGLEARPMERVLGPEMGDFVRALHEGHGVIFHLGDTVVAIDGNRATLKSGGVLQADVVVVGVGVRPRLTLAEKCGLALDRGMTVNTYLETSVAGIYAGGDIARWPDPHSQEKIRVEHWVVAERQGQTAARNMLGQRERFDAVPFFGASITTCRSIMLAMPKHGTKLSSTATLRRRIACFGTRTRAVCSPLLRSIAISQASRPNLKWSEQSVERSMRCLSNNKPSLCFGLDVIGSSHARLIWCTVDVPRSAIRVKIGSAPCKPMSVIGESADFALTESDVVASNCVIRPTRNQSFWRKSPMKSGPGTSPN
jgi:NADPH-dependent 2,4-dienoyl-CoA reductase/sulfur reductase-like enzyme